MPVRVVERGVMRRRAAFVLGVAANKKAAEREREREQSW